MLIQSNPPKTEAVNKLVTPGGFSFGLTAKGLTSKKDIKTVVHEAKPGTGIIFAIDKGNAEPVVLPATAKSVVNTLRNVTIGDGAGTRLCIVEHLLAAVSLWGLEDLVVEIDGPELPLGDGSADIWTQALKDASIEPRKITADRVLKAPYVVTKGDRSLMAIPDEKFSVTYLMDWNHPMIGKRWQSWSSDQNIDELSICRTFGSMKEHQMLGLADDVVSMTEDGFSKPLHFSDEPVRHKLLDLIGDLALIGFNPLRLKARFISVKAGHEMDVELVRGLQV
ncbi:MAG TPA: UDP-3-O-acyl-N-acetylglucosamine deacetylase [Oculatellaceae cyanobacterium]